MIEDKMIDMKAASSLLEEMKNASGEANAISVREFVIRNFDSLDALSRSGKNIRQIYERLKASGYYVGTYHSFRSICYRAGLRKRTHKASTTQKDSATMQDSRESEKVREESPKSENMSKEEHKTKQSKYNPALPPILLPGGVEAIIDPETGAKRFEI